MAMELPAYTETEAELQITTKAAANYIFDGDTLDAVYDLRGLHVFAVIAALRENDERLYGHGANLSQDQINRLAEVERVVDTAVEMDMHYFPFGQKGDKRKLDEKTFARAIGGGSRSIVVPKSHNRNPGATRKKWRSSNEEQAQYL